MIKREVVSGYTTVTMYYDKALEFCPYGSCGVNVRKEGVVLMSYCTPVIFIDNDGWMTCTGTYSRTTITHIIKFLKEYAPAFCYHDVKAAYRGDYAININTAEIRPLI